MSPTYSLVGAAILALLVGLALLPPFTDRRPFPRRRRTAACCVVSALVLLTTAGLLAHPNQETDTAPPTTHRALTGSA